MTNRIMTVLAALAMITLAHAQSGGDYAIVWSTIDGGGGTKDGGGRVCLNRRNWPV